MKIFTVILTILFFTSCNSSDNKKVDKNKRTSLHETELSETLTNNSTDKYFNATYHQEKLISTDDNKMLSITDSLFTTDSENALFFFIVFTKSMNDSDGAYSEALGLSAFDFISKKTECFADYFNISSKLTDKDMDNWAYSIYGEIQISREGEELQAIEELEAILFKNIKGTQKEYNSIIRKLIEQVKKHHTKVQDTTHK